MSTFRLSGARGSPIIANVLFVDLCRSRAAASGAPGDRSRRAARLDHSAKEELPGEGGYSAKGEYPAKGEHSAKGEYAAKGRHQRSSVGGSYHHAAEGELPGKEPH